MARVDTSAANGWFRWRPGALARTGHDATVGPARRVAAAHVVAMLATVVALAVDAGASAQPDAILIGLTLFVAFTALRAASIGSRLAISTLVLDAVGTALLVAGTGGSASAYYFLALAGAWWASHITRRRSGLLWAIAFVAAYGVLVVPDAVRDRLLVHALKDSLALVIVALLSDWFVRVDRRAVELSETLAHAPAGAETLAIRAGLMRALSPMEISLDVLLAAARTGLTVIQAELLAYLQMGLTNQEIADATMVSEATVRYRLTGLYRVLDVGGRKAAVQRAVALAIASSQADVRR